ncbi:hypothetical protein EDC01DRAFT_138208 [Geopyxis carbonaria]|nr:hypothetical protein EDC01DRAFT_138208 [Geopyxis carbonaria]
MPSAMEAPSNRLQVDELILDYILWYCSSQILAESRLRNSPADKQQCDDASRNGDMAIRLVNSFYATFKRLHPHSPLPEPIALRLRICRFTCAFLRRVDITSPSFASSFNSPARINAWLRRRGQTSVIPNEYIHFFSSPSTPFSLTTLQRSQETMLASINENTLRGELNLREVLWEFMLLATHMSARFAEASELWMETTIQFMEQAALEAYRVYGSRGVDAMNEAFGYGVTAMTDDDESIEEIVVNEMFAGDSGAVGIDFENLKNEALREIIPPSGISLEDHFEKLARESPWKVFEDRMVNGYLHAVNKSQPPPALAQLEQGRLEGFEASEIRTVLRNAGVSEEVWR